MNDKTIPIKDSGDHRCYMTEYGIPTIQLGDGGVSICTLSYEHDKCAGIGFGLTKGAIGEFHPETKGKKADEAGIFFQVVSTSPDSLQVMIDRLREAKADWEDRLKNK